MSEIKSQIGSLVSAICEREDTETATELRDFVSEKLGKFTKYFNAVFTDVVQAEINTQLRNTGKISQEQFQFRRETTDSARRAAHDVAIGSCAQLNRLCERYGVRKFCPKTKDRHIIAEFIGDFVNSIYQDGIGVKEYSLDKAIELAKNSVKDYDRVYEPSRIKKEIDEWER